MARRDEEPDEQDLEEVIEEEEGAVVEEDTWYSKMALNEISWWGISVVFHALVIMLLTLLTWVVKDPNLVDASSVVVTTNLEKKIDPLDKYKDDVSKLAGDRDAKATDPDSKIQCDIEVPPDILAKAELGDHFETINPDRPDTKSAFGNPEAHMFHSVYGSDDKAGGGGTGGNTLDEVIGVGGSGSPGEGGGWGGGKGKGIGNDVGDGKGSFGQRSGGGRRLMVMRHGGSNSTERGVTMALEWLAKHQEEDGHWDSMKYGASGKCDSGLTGFAVLAFLGAGHTEKAGRYRDNVQRGVYWLISKQNNEGRVLAEGDGPIGYNHSVAGLALAEAAGMARVPDTVRAAQSAIDYSVNIHQDPGAGGSDKKGWRYSPKQPGDLSVTGWFVMQLKSAKIAGLKVDPSGFQGAINFLDSVEVEKANPNDPYSGHRYGYQPGRVLSKHRNTAMGCLCRQFLGWKREDLQGGVDYMIQEGGVPNWGAADFYYWYYGALVAFQQGGDVWKKWNEAMKPTLIENQRKDGDERGSWDPVGAFGDRGGRVFTTALGCLCLEVYYRYLPMYK